MKDVKKTSPIIVFLIILFFIVGGYILKDYLSDSVDIKEVNDVFNKDNHYMYFYNQLDEKEQEDYRLIYYAAHTFQESVPLSAKSEHQVNEILSYIMFDHPELYYIDTGYQYVQSNNGIEFVPNWLYTQEEIEKYNQKIEQVKEAVLKKVKQKDNHIDQIKEIYDYIINTVTYKESKTDQQIISSLIEKESVCAGYAKAYQYLLNEAGIDSTYIVGKSIGENNALASDGGHAWVMIKIDNDNYYSDPTWGDIVDEEVKHQCYGYFLMNSDDMLKNYKPEVEYEKTQKNEVNYFKNIGSYMTSYDKKVLSHAVKLGIENKTYVAEVKCANDKVYNRVKRALDSEYLGYNVLSENGCYSESSTYYCHDDLRLIELYFK